MAFQLFGFSFQRAETEETKIQTFAPPSIADDLGQATLVGSSSFAGSQLPQQQTAAAEQSENSLIFQYRELALVNLVDIAIEEIVSEMIITDENADSIKLDLSNVEVSDQVKVKIRKSFKKILNLLDFKTKGHDIARRWYVDGRINYHIIIDEKNPRQGIKELRYIDPKKIKRIRSIVPLNKSTDSRSFNSNTFNYQSKIIEYYMYHESGFDGKTDPTLQGIRIAKDSIAHANSGLTDPTNRIIIGFLHKAIPAANKLKTLENSLVIYRLVRAPERRIFYVDVGNLPRARAEQYMNNVMQRYKTKITYDTVSGKIKDDRNIMALTEDYWIPRQAGSKSTEIGTLQGMQANSQVDELEYFKKDLAQSLNVPYSRIAGDAVFALGRSGEISREEARFAKWITRLRTKFNQLFDELLEREIVLSQIMSLEEWEYIKKDVHYEYIKDNYFTELLQADMLASRVATLSQVEPYVGKYFSQEYVMKNILMMTDEEIENENAQIKKEREEDPSQHVPVDQVHQVNLAGQMADIDVDKETRIAKAQGKEPNPFK